MGTWYNSDGLLIRYAGDQGKRSAKVGSVDTCGKLRELVFDVDLSLLGANGTSYSTDRNNDGAVDGFCGLDGFIPAGPKIKEVSIVTVTTPAGGTNYQIGTYSEDGTVDDADGLWTTLGAAGAQVGTSLAALRYIGVKVAGTYTAGKLSVRVVYEQA